MTGKKSASARLFLLVLGLLLLGGVGPLGYMWHANRKVVAMTEGDPTPVPIAELAAVPQPAYLKLLDAIPGEPILVRDPNPPKTPEEKQKRLPPTMKVWVPLFPKGANPKKDQPAAWHQTYKVPDADKYTVPAGDWVGLRADFAFGWSAPQMPKEVRAKYPATAAPVLDGKADFFAITYQLPGVGALVCGVLGLACLVCIPWASWHVPKADFRRKKRTVRLTRPVRPLPADSELIGVCRQSLAGVLSASWYFLLPGVFMAVLFAAIIGTGGPAEGESGFLVVLMGGCGFGLLGYGVWKTWKRAERVEAHREGLRWVRGSQDRSCCWEDVVEVYRTEEKVTYEGVVTTRQTEVWVVLCDGTELSFDHSLPAYDELARLVYTRTFDHLLAVKRRELAGGRAEFGPIDLTADGVEYDSGAKRRWADLTGYRIENGMLWLRDEGLNLLARMDEVKTIPNLPVLLHLLDDRFAEPLPLTCVGATWASR